MGQQIKDVPVYLFTGFLGAGKTTFIQDILSSEEFNEGESTLLLLCEEGETEYDETAFVQPNIHIEKIEDEKEFSVKQLANLERKYGAERVIVEYNGMWMLASFFNAMPPNWLIFQEVTFADATTFMMFNQNMRQLTFDKMQTAEMDIFNRCAYGFDKMAFHKEVRIANRRAQILYEYEDGQVENDTIPDPLPFDINADEIEIKDEDYAEWYRDINENPGNYVDKKLKLHVRVAMTDQLPDGSIACGRHLMTCCVDDIQFAAFIYKITEKSNFNIGDWVEAEATVKYEFDEAYGEEGPVMHCSKIKAASPANPEVATF